MILEKTFDKFKFLYIEFRCNNCKTKGVSLDIHKKVCPDCDNFLEQINYEEKYWSEVR